jgi:hypothetical protein
MKRKGKIKIKHQSLKKTEKYKERKREKKKE